MTMTRNEFLRSLVGVGIGVAGVAALSACGDDADGRIDAGNGSGSDAAGGTDAGNVSDAGPIDGPVDAPPGACTSPTATIGGNHGHTLVVSLADVQAGVDKTYDIQGTSDHPHSVTITAAQFAMLENGQTLNLTSSLVGHTHPVTVRCLS